MDKVRKHFDNVASSYDSGKVKYSYYYSNIKSLLAHYIPKNKSVLEVGCGTGDLLASLHPKNGFGMDLSAEMIKIAKKKHSGIKFSTTWPKTKYEFIFMTDVIEHLENPDLEFKRIGLSLTNDGVFVNTMANPIWEPLLMFWERQGWKMKEGPHERISFDKIEPMLNNAGMKVIKHDYKLLVPINIPFVSDFANRYLERYLSKYAFIEYFVAKKK